MNRFVFNAISFCTKSTKSIYANSKLQKCINKVIIRNYSSCQFFSDKINIKNGNSLFNLKKNVSTSKSYNKLNSTFSQPLR